MTLADGSRSKGIFIREARPEDFPVIVDVWEASVRATHDFVAEDDIGYFRTLVRGGLPHVEHLICARSAKHGVVGFLGAVGSKVEMLFIHPDWRGMGIGRDLMNDAIAEFDISEVDVNEQNDQALGFYLHLGFEVVARSELDGTGRAYPILHLRLRS